MEIVVQNQRLIKTKAGAHLHPASLLARSLNPTRIGFICCLIKFSVKCQSDVVIFSMNYINLIRDCLIKKTFILVEIEVEIEPWRRFTTREVIARSLSNVNYGKRKHQLIKNWSSSGKLSVPDLWQENQNLVSLLPSATTWETFYGNRVLAASFA